MKSVASLVYHLVRKCVCVQVLVGEWGDYEKKADQVADPALFWDKQEPWENKMFF